MVLLEAGLCRSSNGCNVGLSRRLGDIRQATGRIGRAIHASIQETFHVVRNRSDGRLPAPRRSTIEEVMTRTIRGEERTYLKLRVNQGDLEIQVPAENVDLVGVRDIVDEDGLEEVLTVLRAPYLEEPTNWRAVQGEPGEDRHRRHRQGRRGRA